MKTALLIIDIQNDYFPGGKMELVGSTQASSGAARLLAAFRREHWPVFHVQHISMQPKATFFLQDTPGAEIFEAVRPLPSESVIIKNYPNSFRDTDLHEALRSAEVDSLLICGMMSHMCVDATVRAAFDAGFSVALAHDACATRALDFNGISVPADHVHASFMAALGSVYARLQSVEDILENIASTS